ncbi:hypothetical protein [Psychrobacillus sp. FSL K6-1267]|uniref:hypothetical protein n=1 Tax=Psychrobacillus sp. FSL K6-1267 TaxID=2921543 RepID=UPI0030FA437F
MLKLGITIISLIVIYVGIMSSGDSNGFYSSMTVFFAMLILDYHSNHEKFTDAYIKLAMIVFGFFSLISLMGVIDFLTIREIKGQFYISFSDVMRLGKMGIINIHILFAVMVALIVLFSGIEYVLKISKAKKDQQKLVKDGGRKK